MRRRNRRPPMCPHRKNNHAARVILTLRLSWPDLIGPSFSLSCAADGPVRWCQDNAATDAAQ